MKKFLRIIAAMLVFLICVYGYARFIEPNLLNVHYENISNKLISENSGEIKILQFSDTHLSDYFDTKDLQRIVNKINNENPDIVIFSGDLIDYYKNYSYEGDITQISDILGRIKAPLGKYSVYGNHDYGGGAEKAYSEIMKKSGFITLVNNAVKLEKYNINIMGLDDSIFGNIGKEELYNNIDGSYYNIVISHEPDVVDSMLEYDIDLFLSGHSHGGQVNIPFFSSAIYPPLGEKYTRGLYEFENYRETKLYVNIGIGTSQIPFRFMSLPEISVFILKNK
nr:metallophosphoesterase [Sedimentibacter sp.]